MSSSDTVLHMPDERRFALIGGGDMFKGFLKTFATAKMSGQVAVVLAYEETDKGWSTGNYPDIGRHCADLGLDFEPIEGRDTVGLEDAVERHGLNVGLVMGWMALFQGPLINRFQGRFLNFHTSYLPQFRGAGGFTWQIMQGVRCVAASVHQIVPKMDAGALLFASKKRVPDTASGPADYWDCFLDLCAEMYGPLCRYLIDETTLTLTAQDEATSTYYPMFFTPVNGLIDFSWTPGQIKMFVEAVSLPYAGASFTYHEKTYRALECQIVEADENSHPFLQGLITAVNEEEITVFAGTGRIRLSGLADVDGNAADSRNFRLGNRVYNSPEALFNARLYRHKPR